MSETPEIVRVYVAKLIKKAERSRSDFTMCSHEDSIVAAASYSKVPLISVTGDTDYSLTIRNENLNLYKSGEYIEGRIFVHKKYFETLWEFFEGNGLEKIEFSRSELGV